MSLGRTRLRSVGTLLLGLLSAWVFAEPTDTHLLFSVQSNNSSDFLEVAASPPLDLAAGSFTLSAWINPASWGENDQGRILDHGGGSGPSQGWSFLLENKASTGRPQALRVQINNDSSFFLISDSDVVALNEWQHVAVTLEEELLTFYVNGAAVGAHSGVPSPNAAPVPIRIGIRATDFSRGFDGRIDEVRIWNRALSQQEIQASMNTEISGAEPGLLAYFQMNEGVGQTVADIAGNGHDARLGSTTGSDSNDPVWQVTVVANQPPTVDAGADRTIALPTNALTLAGTVNDDNFPGNPVAIDWSVDGGPGNVTFSNFNAVDSDAIFPVAGSYVLRLNAFDGEFSASDTLTVTVDAAPMLTSLVVSPASASLAIGGSQQFNAQGFDQSGNAFPISPTWSATGGSVDEDGLFVAGNSPGNYHVDATDGVVTGTSSVVVSSPSSVWPTNGWETALPGDLGMDSVLLAQARDYALTGAGSGMVTRGGKQVMAWGDQTVRYDLKSSAKSIGVTALGLAILDGLVSLDDIAQQHLPSIGVPPDTNNSTGWLDEITIWQLATHTAGFDKPGGYVDLLFSPGTAWSYTDGGANWLADVLTARYGIDLQDLLFTRVFVHLGVQPSDLTWRNHLYREQTLNGVARREFGSGISANVDAMARIGYLYLRNGQWDGQTVLPTAFVNEASRPFPDIAGLPVLLPESFADASNHYGLLWWNNGDGTLPDVPIDAYWSWGLGDSVIIVIPSLDIVASRAGNGWRPGWDADYAVIDPFITPIAQSVSLTALETVPAVVGLQQAAAEAAIVAANLTVGTVTAQPDAAPVGEVISQMPLGGTDVAAGTAVDLVVSSGPVLETVPAVVGLQQAAAEAAIVAANLTVGTVTTQADAAPVGEVISSNPVGGTQIAAGSAVDLVVSSGPALETVPAVVGLQQAAAEAAIVAANLTVGTVTTQTDAAPVGEVITQTPLAGTDVAAGTAVDLVVSSGPALATVPAVVGLQQAAAEAAIVAANLTVGTVTTQADVAPAGEVISQTPLAGTDVAAGTAVDVVVSSGPAQGTVPAVVGLQQAAAEAAIVAANLTVGTVTTQADVAPVGEVITQTPLAGTDVAAGSAVDLVVSSGPAQETVPAVVGLQQAAAEAAIVAANLTVGTVTTQTDAAPVGEVISSNPVAGTQVAAGSAVDLVVALGPALETVPAVVGLQQAAAEAAIVAANLNVGTVTAQTDAAPAGEVISSNPVAGTQVAAGSAVDLVVSSGPALETVPALVGLQQAAAEAAIVAANLTVGTVTTQTDAAPAGEVISSNPVAGSQLASGSAVDLVVSSGPLQATVPTENYLQFDGVDDVVTVADNASLDITAAITLEAWIRPTTLSNSKAQDRVVHKTTDYELTVSTGDTGCDFGTSGDVQWRASIDGSDQRICGGVLTLGVWQHIAGTYDGNEVVLYVDGLAVASAARSGSIATNTSALYLGNRASANRAFDGSIDEVRIWSRALGPAEIATNRTIELTGDQPELAAYFRLNEGTGQVGFDASPTANNGVLGNSVDPEINDPQWVSSSPAFEVVPAVVGLQQTAAEAAVVLASLVVGTVTTLTDAAPAGEVIDQTPIGGTAVAPGSAVDLVVSSGAPALNVVPALVGLQQAAAEAAIVAANLIVGTVTTQTDVAPVGEVIGQTPPAGTDVAAGTAVDLVVSSGPALETVPAVVGLQQAAAEAAIVAANLAVGAVSTAASATVPAGDVISSNPVAGMQVVAGSAVDLVVSSGPPLETVPAVVGLQQPAAEAAIVAANLTVGTVTTQTDVLVPAGEVLSQTPPGGTEAAPGTAIDLVVSSGPVPGAPSVSLAYPADGATVTGWLTVSADAVDDLGVSSVVFTVNGTEIANFTAPPYEFDWNSNTVTSGTYDLVVIATDSSNNQAGVAATIYVDSLWTQPSSYPISSVITGLQWEPSATIMRAAAGSDNWPITWADDGNLYAAYGDGWGFDPPMPQKLSLGYARIAGPATAFVGENIPSPSGEQVGDGPAGKKASGLLMVDGVLYQWVRNANNNGEHCELAWSTDYGSTWVWNSWQFTELGYCAFLNFGQNYAGAPDPYVYMYSPDTPSAYLETDNLILTRVLSTQITDRNAYEFFGGLDTSGDPIWTTDTLERQPTLTFAGAVNRLDVTYHPILGRYLMTLRSRAQNAGRNQFSIFESRDPWGPWSVVYFTESWEGAGISNSYGDWGDAQHIPSKWISEDGREFYLVFAGEDSFSVRRANLTVVPDTAPPAVSFVSPGEAEAIAGVTAVAAAASDDYAIKSVVFDVDGTFIGEVFYPPFSLDWDTESVATGEHVLTAVATDTSNNQSSSSVTVTVVRPALETVPAVVGLQQAAAEAAIVAANLTAGTVTTQADAAPVGEVITQTPLAGTDVAAGTAVDLVVSSGPALETVPAVVGLQQAAAEAAIVAANLTVGTVTTQTDAAPVGEVISSNPVGGTQVAAGSNVDLVVSSGPALETVPAVVGLQQAAAEAAIVAANLTVGTVTTQTDAAPVGEVITQTPLAGTDVAAGSAVDLVVSSGPALETVPAVVGLQQAAAEAAIVAANLTVGTVTTQTDAAPVGEVITQTPLAGTDVAAGTAVDLVVSSGPALETVPAVVGLQQAAAEAAIVAANLVVGTVTTQTDAAPAGEVISSNPVGGTQVAAGSNVDLVVSSGPALETVPAVVGLQQAAAETAIVAANLIVGTVTTQTDVSPVGEVITQTPLAGTDVAAGTAVDLVVSSGPALEMVPAVVGLQQAAAEAAIVAANLAVGTVTTQTDAAPVGEVISQTPLAGTDVAAGTAVDLVVSSGPALETVPAVVGLQQAAAEAAIVAANLTVGTVTTQTDAAPVGEVITQTPLAGTDVAAGTAVDLVVSSGPALETVPAVVGLQQAAAEAAIVAANLTVGTVTTQTDAAPVGEVITQTPLAGTHVAAGTAVDLVVSSGAGQVTAPTENYLRFDGVDDVVIVPDSTSLDISAAITLEAWIRPDTLSDSKAQDRIIHKTIDYELTVSTGDTGCDFGTTGDVQWRASIDGSNQRICGGVLTPGVWQHIAGTYDGSEVVLYVDGLAVASAPRSGPIATNASALYIGNRANASRAFDGSIDEVRVWNRALTGSEIASNRNNELTGVEPGLVANYRLNESSGQLATDASTFDNDGALGSTVSPEANDPQWESE